ncbi:MAG: Hsp70 family protein [Lachnospiraceae bacterium]|nr:Hsp70 family protein [Lachnospiraceae bacterium]MCM1239867.1 Hsp70 family protein [Lachnospiraceae bacterium]
MIGIDLGTTNSLVCVWEESGVRMLKNRFGDSMTPSVVSFDEDGTVYVGKTARERLVTHPEVTFREFKREMGTETRYTAFGHVYTPEELSALVLKQLKEDAEAELGHPVEEAVISVPAYFNDRQRAATRNAGLLAGLKVDRLINEPSAAALSYHIEHYNEEEMFIVFDFGGGTLDVSLVDSFDNIIEIRTIAGNNKLGGKDFNALIAYDFCEKNGLSWDALSRRTQEILLREAEKTKMKLTDAETALMQVRIDEKEYSYELDNQQLIDFSGELFVEIQKVLTRLMNDGTVTVGNISRVIMVGGSSKMPVVRQFVSRLFQGKISEGGNPDEIVCEGTGILCGIRQRKEGIRDIVLSDICPFTLGVKITNDIMSPIIMKNQTLPCSCVRPYTTVNDYQNKIIFQIYQGENRTASRNLLLMSIMLVIPAKPKGQVNFNVRFSYDINGIFDIDIDCLESGEHVHRELSSSGRMSEEEIRERKAALEGMKIHPREMERNKYLLEQANALYVECNQDQQKFLSDAMAHFENALDSQSAIAVEKAYRTFTVQLSMLQVSMFAFQDFDNDEWDRTFEEDEDETGD